MTSKKSITDQIQTTFSKTYRPITEHIVSTFSNNTDQTTRKEKKDDF